MLKSNRLFENLSFLNAIQIVRYFFDCFKRASKNVMFFYKNAYFSIKYYKNLQTIKQH